MPIMQKKKPVDPILTANTKFINDTKAHITRIMATEGHASGSIYLAPSSVAQAQVRDATYKNLEELHKKYGNQDRAWMQSSLSRTVGKLSADPGMPTGCNFLVQEVAHQYVNKLPGLSPSVPPQVPSSAATDAASLGAQPAAVDGQAPAQV